jgi:hypothetical protein
MGRDNYQGPFWHEHFPGSLAPQSTRQGRQVFHAGLQTRKRWEMAMGRENSTGRLRWTQIFPKPGAVHSALVLFDVAVDALRREIELDPAIGTYHLNLAYVLIRLNREAEPEYKLRFPWTLAD